MTTIEAIPADVIILIAQLAPLNNISNIARVCKRWAIAIRGRLGGRARALVCATERKILLRAEYIAIRASMVHRHVDISEAFGPLHPELANNPDLGPNVAVYGISKIAEEARLAVIEIGLLNQNGRGNDANYGMIRLEPESLEILACCYSFGRMGMLLHGGKFIDMFWSLPEIAIPRAYTSAFESLGGPLELNRHGHMTMLAEFFIGILQHGGHDEQMFELLQHVQREQGQAGRTPMSERDLLALAVVGADRVDMLPRLATAGVQMSQLYGWAIINGAIKVLSATIAPRFMARELRNWAHYIGPRSRCLLTIANDVTLRTGAPHVHPVRTIIGTILPDHAHMLSLDYGTLSEFIDYCARNMNNADLVEAVTIVYARLCGVAPKNDPEDASIDLSWLIMRILAHCINVLNSRCLYLSATIWIYIFTAVQNMTWVIGHAKDIGYLIFGNDAHVDAQIELLRIEHGVNSAYISRYAKAIRSDRYYYHRMAGLHVADVSIAIPILKNKFPCKAPGFIANTDWRKWY